MSLLTGFKPSSDADDTPTALLDPDAKVPVGAAPTPRRPLAAVALLGGLLAALGPLTVCLALGVTGWFLTDAGAHGTSTDGMRVGALAWLMAHGSGLHAGALHVGLAPLGLTLLCAWVTWRLGVRVGEAVSGHGPDAHALADGERDWTVPIAATIFGSGYVAVVAVTTVLAGRPTVGPAGDRALLAALLLIVVVATPAIATGSGRAALWVSWLPTSALVVAVVAARTVLTFLATAALLVAVMLAVHVDVAADVLSRLHVDAGGAALLTLLGAVVAPNAVLFGGSYLLGPGFVVGTGTLVSPAASAVGPLPAFPLLAALPANGVPPAWSIALIGVPFVVGLLATVRTWRRFPTDRWEEGALRGCAGGLLAGLVTGLLVGLAGGAVGPGRMQHVAPLALDALVHALATFGLAGLVGGLAATWWTRRHAAPVEDAS